MTETREAVRAVVPDAQRNASASPDSRLPDSPYKGLIPYDESDSAFFFGRDGERQLIAANLVASRLTLLYGESGAGKTSVLRAGVVHDLRNRALRAVAAGRKPEAIVVEFGTWRDEPLAGLAGAIETSVRLVFGDATPPAPPAETLGQLLHDWTERIDADLLLILDQFEEYLLYHGADDGPGTFADEFPAAVVDRSLRANFLVAIREDALSRLDRFEDQIPDLFSNFFRLEHLDREAARGTILKPVEEYDRRSGQPAHSIEPELVERVLDEVSRGQVVDGQTGQGTVGETSASDRHIETPYLQLVLSRLWESEAAAGSLVMRLSTLEQLGGSKKIVQNHLDEAMAALSPARRDVAGRVFQYLVTSAGAKIALSADELAGFSGVPARNIEPVLRDLADLPVDRELVPGKESARILRSVAPPPGSDVIRYEIYHDVLGPAVLAWRTRYGLARARRRVRIFALGVVLAVAASVVAAGFAVQGQRAAAQARDDEAAAVEARIEAEQTQAKEAAAQAEAQAHMVLAGSQLGVDPQASVHHALQAWDLLAENDIANRASAEETVRLALSNTRLDAVVQGHTSIVWFADFSPDGKMIVTASEDYSARIADAATGTTLHLLGPGEDPVLNARFTPDGRKVVTVDLGGKANLWDAATGALLVSFDHLESDPDALLVNLAATDGWNGAGRYIATGPFTSDGRYLVTSAGHSARIWDLDTGKPGATFKHPSEAYVYSAAFSADGTQVVTAADDGIVRAWEVASGDLLAELTDGESTLVSAATFSPDGSLIASANSNGSVGFWDAGTRRLIESLTYHDSDVVAVAFSADGTRVVSAGDTTTAIFDVTQIREDEGPTLLSFLDPTGSQVRSASFSPDGSYVVTAYVDGTAHVALAANGYEVRVLRGHDGSLLAARFSPDGQRIVTAGEDQTARVWDISSGESLIEHSRAVTAVAFSHDGRTAATGSADETAALLDLVNGDSPRILQGEEAPVGFFQFLSVEFSADDSELLTVQSDGTVQRWDVTSGEALGACCQVEDQVATTATYVPGHPDEVLAAYDDGFVRRWDVAGDGDGRMIEELDPEHSFSETSAMGISPDGSRVITVGGFDRLVKVWDARTFEALGEWEIGPFSSGDFSPDGSRFVVASGTSGARVVDTLTGTEVISTMAGSSPIVSATYSPDGEWIVTGQLDGSTRVWNAHNGAFLAELRMQARAVNSVDVLGDRIIAGSTDGTAKIFACEICGKIEDVVEMARAQADLFEPEMTQPEDYRPGDVASPGPASSPGASPSHTH